MCPLPLLRGEKLSAFLKRSLDSFRAIIRLKSTGRRYAGRKAERRIVQARFFDFDFLSSFSLRDPSPSYALLILRTDEWTKSTRPRGLLGYREWGTVLSRSEIEKKGSRLVFTFRRVPRIATQVCHCRLGLKTSRAREILTYCRTAS